MAAFCVLPLWRIPWLEMGCRLKSFSVNVLRNCPRGGCVVGTLSAIQDGHQSKKSLNSLFRS